VISAATFFPFLQTDDFCTFGRVIGRHGGNPFAELASVYGSWTGRYSSSFLLALAASLGAIIPVPVVYPAVLASFLLLFGVACWAVSRLPAKNGHGNLPLALVAFTSTLLLMPSKLEQYLWLTGAAVYFVGASLVLLLVHRLAASDEPGPHPRREVTLMLIVVLATGFNEFLALVVGACLAWAALRNVTGPERHLWKVHVLRLVVFAVALGSTVLAPGNFARDAGSAVARQDLASATAMMFQSLAGFAGALARESAWLWLATLGAALFAGMVGSSAGPRPARVWLPYALILLAAFPMHLWVYSFLTGEPTPGRVINQALTLAHVAVCLLVAWAGMLTRLKSQPVTSPRRAAVGLAVAAVLVVASPSTRGFLTTLSQFAYTWHVQQLERHHGLSAVSADDPVYLRPFAQGDSSPPMFAGSDISANPDYWVNQCVSDYYGVDSVILMRRTY